MAYILQVKGIEPKINQSAWLAPNATITGDVTIGASSSVWFQAVIRGDVNKIRIGDRVNIQDGVIIHGTLGGIDTIIEDEASIGHGAIIHGCTIQSNALIGMGAVVLDEAIVESQCIIAAGAVVTSGTVCKSGWIYAGTPAKPIKKMDSDKLHFYTKVTAEKYVKYKTYYESNGDD